MLTIYTEGYGYSKRLCKDVVTWFVSKYLPRYKLEIEVLHRGLKRDGVVGWCDVAGETYKPREFLIELDTYLNKETYVRTLLHECVHIQQFVSGELKLKASPKGDIICYMSLSDEYDLVISFFDGELEFKIS
jgi:hypothetical protein